MLEAAQKFVSRQPMDRLRETALALFAIWAAVAHLRAFGGYVFEDAYITYRYAANLADGVGFVFNPGERVLGTSTPFYTMLLAFCAKLGFDVAVVSEAIFSISISLLGLAGARLLSRRGAPNLGVLYAVLVIGGIGDVFHFWGMETALYSLLLLLTITFAAENRPTLTGVALALAFLTRYDAFMLVATLFLVLCLRRRTLPWRTYLVAGAIVAPWLLFAQLYFGSVLPNTLAAKTDQVTFAAYLYDSAGRLIEAALNPFLRFGPQSSPAPIVLVLLLLALIAPVFSQTRAVLRRSEGSPDHNDVLGLLLAVPLLHWLGYAAIGPPLAHRWYLVPGLFLFVLFCLLAWAAVFARPGRVAFRGKNSWAALASGLLLVGATLWLAPAAQTAADHKTGSARYDKRVEAYRLMAQWIDDHQLNDLTLLTREPGFLTYRTGNPVIDGAGLVTPGISVHGPKDEQTPWEEILLRWKPQMVVGSVGLEERERMPGYVRVFAANQVKILWMDEQTFREQVPILAEDWLRDDFYFPRDGSPQNGDRGDLDPPGHPLVLEFEGDDPLQWVANDRSGHRFHRPPKYPDDFMDGEFLHTWGTTSHVRVVSDPFRIDFDTLTFDFSADLASRTRIELVVNGVVVLSRGGGRRLRGQVQEVRWNVHAWRGKIGLLRLVDTAVQGGVAALDNVRSGIWENPKPLDDFESGAWNREIWQTVFGDKPCLFPKQARRHGLEHLFGRFTASTICLPENSGRASLVSHPFLNTHQRLAFAVTDFSDRSSIELRSGDTLLRRLELNGSGKSLQLDWDLSRYQDIELVLAISGPAGLPGTGIDNIVLHDGLATDSSNVGDLEATALDIETEEEIMQESPESNTFPEE